jgi:hypothetical protein
MPLDPESFMNVAAGLQSIVTLLGIIVGGVWVLYTFTAVGTVQKANAEIAALRQSAARQPILQIGLQPKLMPPSPSGTRWLPVSVKLKNDGNSSLVFTAPVLELSKMPSGSAKQSASAKTQRSVAQFIDSNGKLEDMPERFLRAGQARTVVFLIEVLAAGWYLLQITSNYSGAEIMDGEIVRGEIKDGKFEASEEAEIQAWEQVVLEAQ